MTETIRSQTGERKQYDLEERTLEFAKRARVFVKKIPKTLGNIEDGKQLINASGSVGANYIEANEALSKKDFVMRIKICRKEAKESRYWSRLIDTEGNEELVPERQGNPPQGTLRREGITGSWDLWRERC